MHRMKKPAEKAEPKHKMKKHADDENLSQAA